MFGYILTFALGFIFCKILPDLRHRAFAALVNWIKKSFHPKFEGIKAELFSELKNKKGGQIRILEVGVGTGTNFKFYPDGCHLIAVDPNHHFQSYYNENRSKFSNIKSEEIVIGYGEDMNMVPDSSVDAVVISKVLCCVNDVSKFLKEVKRVLMPGDKLYFIEHVREWDSEKHGTRQLLQDILSNFKIWPALFDGCMLNTQTGDMLRSAQFSDVTFKRTYGPYGDSFLFHLSNCFIVGTATK